MVIFLRLTLHTSAHIHFKFIKELNCFCSLENIGLHSEIATVFGYGMALCMEKSFHTFYLTCKFIVNLN